MKKPNKAGAKALCAVIMALAMTVLSVPASPVRAETPEERGGDDYKYAVTIEFGSMTFCYDYGSWNVNEMRYCASAGSKDPANGTFDGYPGWYGFDGMANRISVKYSNRENTQNRLSVELSYRALSANEGKVVDNVSMEFYKDRELTDLVETGSALSIPHTPPENVDEKTTIYASLRGEPQEGGNKYFSDSFVPIGMLTIRVGEITD